MEAYKEPYGVENYKISIANNAEAKHPPIKPIVIPVIRGIDGISEVSFVFIFRLG